MYVGVELKFRTEFLSDAVFSEKNGRGDNYADDNFYLDFLKCTDYTIYNIVDAERGHVYSCDLNKFLDISNSSKKVSVELIKTYGILPDDYREEIFLRLLNNKKFLLKDMETGSVVQSTLIEIRPIYDSAV